MLGDLAAADAAQRRECLTVVVIGGGLVGTELVGELTAFADDVLRFYPRIRRDEVCFRLYEAGPRILPEIDAKLAATAARVLERRGVGIKVSTGVRSIDRGHVRLESDTIDAGTIVLTAGIIPSAVASAIAVVRDQRGRIAVEQAPRVALARRDEQGRGQRKPAADLLGQDRFDRRTDPRRVAGGDRGIDPVHESGDGRVLHRCRSRKSALARGPDPERAGTSSAG